MPYRKVTYLEQIWFLIKFRLTTGNGKGRGKTIDCAGSLNKTGGNNDDRRKE